MNPKLETLSVFITSDTKNPFDSHCLIYDPTLKTRRPCSETWSVGLPKCLNCFFSESNHKHGLAVSETIHESINKNITDILK